jgi:phage gp45-like
MIDDEWSNFDQHQRTAYRARNAIGRVTLNLPDDSQPVQQYQTQGHIGEIRDQVITMQFHGFSSLSVAGTKGIALYPAGDRGNGVIIGTVNTKYRPIGLSPGELQLYLVDSAAKDGTGGTTRTVFSALLGWVTSIFGKNVNIGDSNTAAIVLTGTSIKIVGNLEITGDLKVDGTTNVQNLNIAGSEAGGGSG